MDIDLKTVPAQSRVLVTVLIIAVAALFGIVVKQSAGDGSRSAKELAKCENEKLRLRIESDSLKYEAIRKAILDNDRLKQRIAWQDSIKSVLETIIKTK